MLQFTSSHFFDSLSFRFNTHFLPCIHVSHRRFFTAEEKVMRKSVFSLTITRKKQIKRFFKLKDSHCLPASTFMSLNEGDLRHWASTLFIVLLCISGNSLPIVAFPLVAELDLAIFKIIFMAIHEEIEKCFSW